ncbi:MAG: hypothetical protein KDD36_02940 [Flavobacteriales bacterium]|nr:hypothetical protein [Flavobacteriales bacterium]
MKNPNTKWLIFIPLVISVISAILILVMLFKGDDAVKENPGSTVVPLFYITYIVLALCTLGAIVFPIIQIIQHPKNIKTYLISLGAIGVVFILSYVMASDVVPAKLATDLSITSGDIKWSGTGLIMFYILLAIAAVGILYSEVSRLFK